MIIIILYFFLGMAVVPLLSGFVDLVLTFFEYLKSFMGKKIMENNAACGFDEGEGASHAIGFQYQPLQEEEYYEEDV